MKKIFNGRKFVTIDEVYLEDGFYNHVVDASISPAWVAWASGDRFVLCRGHEANTGAQALALSGYNFK